jgi:hypothetical protein
VGHDVVASDLIDYQCPNSTAGVDFLMENRAPEGVECICTNPPYSLCGRAAPYVAKALELSPLVVLLLRLPFLEAQQRVAILSKLSRVHIFRDRLPMMHRQNWTGNKSTSDTCFAWFVFDSTHVGPPTLNWIWADTTKQTLEEKRRARELAAKQMMLPLRSANRAGRMPAITNEGLTNGYQ